MPRAFLLLMSRLVVSLPEVAIFADSIAMQSPFVMTIISPDRPGLVDEIAAVISENGGNWLESRMCHLGGQFAGILRIDVDDAKRSALQSSLSALASDDIEIVIHDDSSESTSDCSEVVAVEILGQDRPGIVRQIANAFAKRNVNVEELSTECRSAPMSGEQLFQAKARVCIPADCDTDSLKQELEMVAADLLVDISFESVT